jgi:spore coat polysaccharide biosynthesis protein SpsF
MMNIGAIIQARMGSTRLPGKVLMNISGKPMLRHVVDRLKYSRLINKVIIAAANEGNSAIADFCKDQGLDHCLGSKEDVLDRYYQAAKMHQFEVVVRITADCPLIDPAITDDTISLFLSNRTKASGASNVIKRTFPRGLDTEVICFSALEKAWQEARGARYREHVIPYIYEHPERFKMLSLENKEDLSGLRWTVDEKNDFNFVSEIYKRLYREKSIFYMQDVLAALSHEPELYELNKEVKQKVERRSGGS